MNPPNAGDKQLECADCKKTFFFTAGEQAFFAQKGFQEPRRCKSCREARKQRQTPRED